MNLNFKEAFVDEDIFIDSELYEFSDSFSEKLHDLLNKELVDRLKYLFTDDIATLYFSLSFDNDSKDIRDLKIAPGIEITYDQCIDCQPIPLVEFLTDDHERIFDNGLMPTYIACLRDVANELEKHYKGKL